ncbi:hypothetical protein ENU1_021340 [Entamoeba nuttalli P19]|uniref:TLDc domain-containing protein n=1 Tax=Entamoeba nuttalli (strain P19) TaxID=1076696 RepID=K2H4F3_ENTNP|nr:hypothetical protein ENU1_021340 [Entamoeba nuttalli P19]EKE42438.1 hypothetical protein ENU1_021340 [Entamoeba nuttalli P19]|eukprot:XP_008855228.1 hypothetical protein ENU1_021340 [Entamoeba nuttalli P19]
MVIKINKLINFGYISIHSPSVCPPSSFVKSVTSSKTNHLSSVNEIINSCDSIHLPQCKVLYDSEIDCLDSFSLFSKIHGRKNVHLIVKTLNGHLFGSFHSSIPFNIKHGIIQTDCTIFKLSKPPLVLFPNKQLTSIQFNFEDKTTIYTIVDAFSIRKETGLVYPTIKHNYHSSSSLIQINPSILAEDRTFSIQRIIAFETEADNTLINSLL